MKVISIQNKFVALSCFVGALLTMWILGEYTNGMIKHVSRAGFLISFLVLYTAICSGFENMELLGFGGLLLILAGIITVPEKSLINSYYLGSLVIPFGVLIFALIALVSYSIRKTKSTVSIKWRILVIFVAFLYLMTIFNLYYLVAYWKMNEYLYNTPGKGLFDADGSRIIALSDYVYFSGVTYFTVGYGDIVPKGKAIKMYALSEMIIACLISIVMIPCVIAIIISNKSQLEEPNRA